MEAVMHGLYLLWWVEERHVSPALVAAILAAGDLAIALLEAPTGWLADRCGYRLSLIAGSAVQVTACYPAAGWGRVCRACSRPACSSRWRRLAIGRRSGAALRHMRGARSARRFQRLKRGPAPCEPPAMVGPSLVGARSSTPGAFAAGRSRDRAMRVRSAIAWRWWNRRR